MRPRYAQPPLDPDPPARIFAISRPICRICTQSSRRRTSGGSRTPGSCASLARRRSGFLGARVAGVADVDPAFLALPLRRLADAALTRAAELGAEHADFRLERIRNQELVLRDGRVDSARDGEDLGLAVRVVHDGTWGFAAGVDLTPEAARRVADQAVEVARVSRPVNSEPVELADEPVHGDVTWVSAYDVDP